MTYQNAEEWWYAAMQRQSRINEKEQLTRRKIAQSHNRENNITAPDTLADQELYIQGKMELAEYEAYLLFKHTPEF